MTPEKLQRLKEAAQQWDITIQSTEPGYEWYKASFVVKTPEDGQALVELLNEAINMKFPPAS